MEKINKLKKINRLLEKFINKATTFSRENFVLLSVSRSNKYKEFKEKVEKAFLQQISEVLRRPEIEESVSKIRKEDKTIWTERDEKEVEKQIDENIKPLSDYLDIRDVVDFFAYCANRGGQAFFDKVGIDAEFDILGDKDINKIKKINEGRSQMYARADNLIIQLDKTTQKNLVNSINKGRKEGQSYPMIVNQIRKKIPDMTENRAKLIARTEMGELVNDTEMRAARMNHAELKEWSAAGPNICKVCAGNDEEKIGLDGVFGSGHNRPPAHPNCKCLLEYKMPPITTETVWTGSADASLKDIAEADLDRMYHRANIAKKEIDNFADELAATIPNSRVAKAPLKGRKRAMEKIMNDYGGEASSLQDIARNTVVAKTGKDVLKVYEDVKYSPKVVKANMKQTSLGYDGAMLKVKTDSGHITEMQIVSEKMIYAKEIDAEKILGTETFNRIKKETGMPHGLGHEYYEEWRVEETIEKREVIAKKSSSYYAHFKD